MREDFYGWLEAKHTDPLSHDDPHKFLKELLKKSKEDYEDPAYDDEHVLSKYSMRDDADSKKGPAKTKIRHKSKGDSGTMDLALLRKIFGIPISSRAYKDSDLSSKVDLSYDDDDPEHVLSKYARIDDKDLPATDIWK